MFNVNAVEGPERKVLAGRFHPTPVEECQKEYQEQGQEAQDAHHWGNFFLLMGTSVKVACIFSRRPGSLFVGHYFIIGRFYRLYACMAYRLSCVASASRLMKWAPSSSPNWTWQATGRVELASITPASQCMYQSVSTIAVTPTPRNVPLDESQCM